MVDLFDLHRLLRQLHPYVTDLLRREVLRSVLEHRLDCEVLLTSLVSLGLLLADAFLHYALLLIDAPSIIGDDLYVKRN
jgi:hypothetical protein